ncbi:FAR1-related sequence 5-like protein [Tanacetum coccineum]
MGVSEMVPDHDRVDSSMGRDQDIGESSMVRDEQDDNQIVLIPEHLQHTGTINKNIVDISFYVDDSHEFQPTPNGTPYWVPDVPEDEKPKEGLLFDSYNDAYETYLVYSQKARFNIRKGGFKRKNGQKTHAYFQCNRAGKPRRSKEVNTLNEVDGDDGENSASKKRKRHSKSQAINCPAKLCLKKINGTESYEVLGFVENHNHPLMNLNNMDLSRARRQLHFDDYIFIHRASMSNLGPTRAHRLKAALVGGYDKVRGTSTDYCNFKRCVNSFIGDRDAQMLVDKMCKRKLHVPEFCFEYYTLPLKEVGDLAADTNFRKDFHKLVWNVYIGPDVFEQQWNDMISQYNLHDNKWLFDIYAIRERWVPGFFKDVPMCGLMKTTSRSESSNAFFQIYSHEGNTLVQFMLCFESAMEKQRYIQRVLDNALNGSTPTMLIELPFEKHACNVNDTDKLSELLSTIQDLKKKFANEMQTPHVELNKDALYSYLLDVSVPDKVVIKTPKSIFRSKGTSRIKSAAKKGCSACGEPGHHKGICKKFPNQDKGGRSEKNVVIDDEDEGDTDDQFDDEALGATEDEVDEDDEIDEEYESDEV